MRSTWYRFLVLPGLLALGTLTLAGCGTYGRSVEVSLSPRLAEAAPSVEVNIAGVEGHDLDTWVNYSMSKYWSDQNPKTSFRLNAIAAGVVKVVRLGSTPAGNVPSFTLGTDDPIWAKWKERGVESILVLSSVPTNTDDAPGAQDPRRRIFHVGTQLAPNGEITLEIERHGLVTTKG